MHAGRCNTMQYSVPISAQLQCNLWCDLRLSISKNNMPCNPMKKCYNALHHIYLHVFYFAFDDPLDNPISFHL